jgi:iron complex transport system substrate-binding protein
MNSVFFRACALAVAAVPFAGCSSSCGQPQVSEPDVQSRSGSATVQEASAEPEADTAVDQIRAVSLIPNITEIVFAIGAGDRLVGRSQNCDFPPEAGDVASVGSGLAPDVETIISLQPDVVLGTSLQMRRAWARTIEEAGAELITVPDVELDDIPAGIRVVGAALDASEAAEALAVSFEERLTELRSRELPETPPTVLLVIGLDPLFVSGPESRMEPLVRFAGGANAIEAGSWVQLEAEALAAADPDVVVVVGPGQRGSFESRYSFLTAVQQGHVCDVDPNVITRPGPRILDSVLELEQCLALLENAN